MTQPIRVTEEMRQAVYAADCEEYGHKYQVVHVFTSDPHGANGTNELGHPKMELGSPEGDVLPHLSCERCSKAWLVVPDAGDDYEVAETQLQERLKATSELSKKITEIRNRRKKRRNGS